MMYRIVYTKLSYSLLSQFAYKLHTLPILGVCCVYTPSIGSTSN